MLATDRARKNRFIDPPVDFSFSGDGQAIAIGNEEYQRRVLMAKRYWQPREFTRQI
jgi:hypothetical protein